MIGHLCDNMGTISQRVVVLNHCISDGKG